MYRNLKIQQQRVLLLTLCFLYIGGAAYGTGDLDTTFDGDGKVTTDISNGGDLAYAVVVQPDGKIVAGGGAGVAANGFDFSITRYNANGSLDTTFGDDGVVTTHFDSDSDFATALALQADQKIVAAGSTRFQNDPNDQAFALARYDTNGNPDNTFGPNNDGKVITNLSPGFDQIHAVFMQGDLIVVAGFTTSGGFQNFAMARYTPDGDLDTNFGSGGIVTQSFCNSDDRAESMIIPQDGTIFVAGVGGISCSDFMVARFDPNGIIDQSFGNQGIATADFGLYEIAYGIALDANGKIVVAGHSDQGGTLVDFAVARFDGNGNLDSSFDTDGKQTTDFGSTDFGSDVVLQPDGKIVVAGFTGPNGMRDFALVRYNSDGSHDPDFGAAGLVITPFGSGIDEANGVALQPDGKIIAAGWTQTGIYSDFALARYHGLPHPPCLFCDDFENSVLASDWTYIKQAWNEADGNLIGSPAARKAETIAAPAFAGCTVCTVETTMMTAGGKFNKVWLLAWHQDKKNTVEVLMKEENDKWIVKQRSGGSIVAKGKARAEILPNSFYNVKISFDGANFSLTINNTQLLTMPAAHSPNGTIGFRVKNTTGSFGSIVVN